VVLLVASVLSAMRASAWVGSAATPVPYPAAAPFDYQIGGAFTPAAGVKIVDRDRLASPVKGLYNICYVNAYQAQTDQAKWWLTYHATLILRNSKGQPIIDTNWDEMLLDVSTAAKRTALLSIIGHWFDLCAQHGFQAIEPDNLDSYTRSQNLLTAAEALTFAGMLASRAHADNMLIGQKNASDISVQAHRAGDDFAITEQCQAYSECQVYTAVYGHKMIEIEYDRTSFTQACKLRPGQVSINLRDVNVSPPGPGFVDQRC
jgi:hypothetical protein